MSRVEIRDATVRDVSFVAAHMRAIDAAEIFCQLSPGAGSPDVAAICLGGGGLAWCAWVQGSPVCAFGVAPASHCGTVWSAWAFGTRRMTRAVPAITRFCLSEVAGALRARGCRRLEARSIASHGQAHRWLARLGARREARLNAYGRNGDAFTLWAWTEDDDAGP